MSDLFAFKGAEGAGYAQPAPISADYEIPTALRRANLPRWPRASEPEIVRHYTWLSTRSHGIDSGFYPLGSCTMKHNPRVNERIVQMPGMNWPGMVKNPRSSITSIGALPSILTWLAKTGGMVGFQ